MSERGTFVTSFLYDVGVAPILERLLPAVCRRGCMWVNLRDPGAGQEARVISGLMHGGYDGEEAWQMDNFIEDVLLPALPEYHGDFSIVVLPEWEEHTTIFTIKGRTCTRSTCLASKTSTSADSAGGASG